jgi:hypothetical protein
MATAGDVVHRRLGNAALRLMVQGMSVRKVVESKECEFVSREYQWPPTQDHLTISEEFDAAAPDKR